MAIGIAGGAGVLILVAIVFYGMARSGKLSIVGTSLNPSELQGPMDNVLKDDYRNSGIRVAAYYRSPVDSSILVYDLLEISGTNSRADVFRVLIQFADKMQHKLFSEIHLCYKGTVKFRLPGSYFSKIGREYAFQNAVYTMRTFPEHLLTNDGQRAYPVWEGGVFGVLEKQMQDFNDFHDRWYLNDLRYERHAARSGGGSYAGLLGRYADAS